jgi:hypothetical protein
MSTTVKFNDHSPLASQDYPDAKAVLSELDRILTSRFFKDATRGRQFLEYVVRYKLEGHSDPIKERTIGIEVFHRPAGYQTGDDSVVRVQASEVRRRLEQFYQSEGLDATVRIELPLGSYSPVFRNSLKHESSKSSDIEPTPAHQERERARFIWKHWQALAVLATFLCLVVGVAILVRNHFLSPRVASEVSKSDDDAELTSFWKKPSSSNGVVVSFTNPEFLESKSGQLLPYYGPRADRGSIFEGPHRPTKRDGMSSDGRGEPLTFEDGFTGTGEVFAASSLAEMLHGMDIKMNLFRSRALPASEFSDHDIVFLGSPAVNGLLAKVNLPKRFVFRDDPGHTLFEGEIEDTYAETSSARTFKVLRDPQTHVIQSDYGLFQVFPGPAAGHRIILLAGLTTTGTQGAAAFATSSDGLSQVRKLLGLTNPTSAPIPEYFECLLRVDAAGGLDVLRVTPVSCSKEP